MKLISCHIPKCGGLSFKSHLTYLFGKRVIDDYNHTDRPGYRPESPNHYLLAQLRNQKKVTVIHGHFFLSKYRHIPNVQRVMWFRNPVDRLLSHYYYWLRSADYDHPNCRKLHEDGLSIMQFAQIPQLKNVFTRFLDGEPLAELDFIGLVEDYQASIDLFYSMYATGRNPRKINPHENKNSAKPEGYELDEDQRKKIEQLNRDDMVIYDVAKRKFKELVERFGNGY